MECLCSCGCGETVTYKHLCPAQLANQGPKRYIQGHQNRGRTKTPAQRLRSSLPMEKNGRWKGGRFIDQDGYALVKKPDHPAARLSGYVLEHRLAMEAHLGRFLTEKEVVHHKNSNKSDNRLDNLELLTGQSIHMVIERTGKKYPRKNGLWFICQHCQNKFYMSAYWAKRPPKFCSWTCRYRQ